MFPLAFFGSSIGAGEILLVFTIALLLFGADRLPALAKAMGKAVREFRRASRELSDHLSEDIPPLDAKSDAASFRISSDSSRKERNG